MTLDEIIVKAQPLIEEMARRRNKDKPSYYLFGLKKGKKYVKIMRGTVSQFNPAGTDLIHCEGFIDENGNVLFPASYYSPAKGASAIRGNLDVNNGFDALDDSGNIRYIRGGW
ncbi:hypothetical protein JC221_239 [Yersinia phage JC221]|nr:hypothetical protein JC221_239 [Yersinia phage JC221]